ncbi:hypothetical protein HN011_000627 [Eciton burchellii]|nr:hypothetical protein HN011_000627 [Eciton burchellii]
MSTCKCLDDATQSSYRRVYIAAYPEVPEVSRFTVGKYDTVPSPRYLSEGFPLAGRLGCVDDDDDDDETDNDTWRSDRKSSRCYLRGNFEFPVRSEFLMNRGEGKCRR